MNRHRHSRPRRINPPKLQRWHYGLLVAALAGLWLSGAVWLLLHYFLKIEGEFGLEMHPLEPWMLRLHGFFMLPALLALGGLLTVHVVLTWSYRKRRFSGFAQCAIYFVLIVTGYVLYYSGDDSLRELASWVHWMIGLAAPVLFLSHIFARDRRPSS